MEEVEVECRPPTISYSNIPSCIPNSESIMEEVGPADRPPLSTTKVVNTLVKPVLGANLPAVHVFGSFIDNNSYSPIPVYPEVTVTFVGGGTLVFKNAQEDTACDAGVAISLTRMLSLSENKPGWLKYVTTVSTAANSAPPSMTAVCEVQIPSIGLKTFTTAVGMPGVPDNHVLVGRFMVGDVQNRLMCGPLANPIQLPLHEERLDATKPVRDVVPGSYSLSACPDYETLQRRFVASPTGKVYMKLADDKAKDALFLFKHQEFVPALDNFQWLSVYGVFIWDQKSQDAVIWNMARAYFETRQMGLSKYWASELSKRRPNEQKYKDFIIMINNQ